MIEVTAVDIYDKGSAPARVSISIGEIESFCDISQHENLLPALTKIRAKVQPGYVTESYDEVKALINGAKEAECQDG